MKPEKLLVSYADAWDTHDLEAMQWHLTDDCCYFDAFFADLVPYDNIPQYFRYDFECSDLRHSVTDIIRCDSTTVMSRYKTEIVNEKGKNIVSFAGAEVLALRHGKICRITDYYTAPPQLLSIYYDNEKSVADSAQYSSTLESYYSKILQCRSDFLRTIRKDRRYVSRDLSLSTIAEEIGFDEEFVGSVIAQEFRCSFHEFVDNCRVESAKEMIKAQVLLDPMSSGQEQDGRIARKVGFASKSSFIEAFRRVYNLGPLQYRRIARSALAA